jgi:hypothetical protein
MSLACDQWHSARLDPDLILKTVRILHLRGIPNTVLWGVALWRTNRRVSGHLTRLTWRSSRLGVAAGRISYRRLAMNWPLVYLRDD